jgi:hypothetical protein
MGITHNNIRRYRFSDNEVLLLASLKKYSIIESNFVRQAIAEKLQRDLPALKIEHERFKYPF